MSRSFIALCAVILGLGLTLARSLQPEGGRYLVDGICASNHYTSRITGRTTRSRAASWKAASSRLRVITEDRRSLSFDTSGNEKALTLIKATDKAKDWKVVVSGKVDDQRSRSTASHCSRIAIRARGIPAGQFGGLRNPATN